MQGFEDLEELTADFSTWWNYHYYKISFSSDFIALDENAKVISKKDFLIKLTSGNYISIESKVKAKADSISYKLVRLPEGADKSISTTIKNSAAQAFGYYEMEGKKFPEIDLTAINGQQYKNESLIGKITIIKTWFIACKPCIAEMPELNEFVHKYRNESDIQFLSLATDSQSSLEDFLTKRAFDYVVFPDQEELIIDQLNLQAYPTHLVLDKNGNIKKIFNKASELMAYIDGHKSLLKI
ncbi:hypothetical protein CQA01_24350 [Cyclobacterium qasimii]|nr:hypothetical protein CQA01_24350 [Cyclobacterium qasimii]